jgi:hypothetical protein
MKSQNGYTVLDPQDVVKWVVPGTRRHFITRPGPVGFVQVHFALFFDEEIEPLDREQTWDDWGYNRRQIAGSSLWSNHASATALDLNAVQHPQGKRGTFTDGQEREFRKRLDFMDNVIRWGGDFNTTPDEMHWEIDKPRDQVVEVAKRLYNTRRGEQVRKANPHFSMRV